MRQRDSYDALPTEQIAADGPELDLMPPGDIARLLLREESRARTAAENALPAIERACDAAASALRGGGRIIYIGAGTSGRLGILDASEMPPTFGADPGRVVGLIAGGAAAMTRAVEGAEDDAAAGRVALLEQEPTDGDVVIGVSMSGTARFVQGALAAAPQPRVVVTANPNSALEAEIRIVLDLGPELLAGSSRLKGGSATKVVLNMISTAAMAASGAVYGNLMVGVKPSNQKLRDRAERLVAELAAVPRDRAGVLLRDGGDDVRVSVLMSRLDLSREQARARLDSVHGSLRKALAP